MMDWKDLESVELRCRISVSPSLFRHTLTYHTMVLRGSSRKPRHVIDQDVVKN